jgi:hypothetical protein
LLLPGDKPPVQGYIDKYLWLAKLRLSQLAAANEEWWLPWTEPFRRFTALFERLKGTKYDGLKGRDKFDVGQWRESADCGGASRRRRGHGP